jgi:hypothetical protein
MPLPQKDQRKFTNTADEDPAYINHCLLRGTSPTTVLLCFPYHFNLMISNYVNFTTKNTQSVVTSKNATEGHEALKNSCRSLQTATFRNVLSVQTLAEMC